VSSRLPGRQASIVTVVPSGLVTSTRCRSAKRLPRGRPRSPLPGQTPLVAAESACARRTRPGPVPRRRCTDGNRERSTGRWSRPAGTDEATYPVISGVARLGPRSAAQARRGAGHRSIRGQSTCQAPRTIRPARRLPDPTDAHATRLRLTSRGTRHARVMPQRLSAILDAYFSTRPPEEAANSAVSFRRFVRADPFHP